MTSTTTKIITEALDRVVDFFSLPSSIVSNEDKIAYINEVSEEYSADSGLFSVCLSNALLSAREDLYRSVWPLVEYK